MELIVKIIVLITLFLIEFRCCTHIVRINRLYKKTNKKIYKREIQATVIIFTVALIIAWMITTTFN